MQEESLHTSPQLEFVEQNWVAVALSHKQVFSLYKKSEQSGIPFDTLEEVYRRGYREAVVLQEQPEPYAFNRVNSFISGGAAIEMDKDLNEKRGLWDNIHAKRERIKHGSGEHMRKPGSKGAPTAAALKASQSTSEAANPAQQAAIAIAMKKAGKKPHNESYTGSETVSKNPNDPSSRFDGTDSLVNIYKNATPGQSSKSRLGIIKKVVREQLEEFTMCENCTCIEEDAKGYKNPSGGLTQKGRDHYNRETGGHLKAPVTTEPSKLKKGSKAANRRKSFCARMGGVEGPMKKPNGEPTRKALALRKWNC
jgi:hypothetical protein